MSGRSARRVGVSVVGLAAAALLLVGCMTAEESAAFDAINADRAANGRAALAPEDALQAKAQNWAQHLADASGGRCSAAQLSHSSLTAGAPAGWKALGENVTCRETASSIAAAVGPLEASLMASPGHRANILNSGFTHVGVGMAAVASSTHSGYIVVFEAQDFAQL